MKADLKRIGRPCRSDGAADYETALCEVCGDSFTDSTQSEKWDISLPQTLPCYLRERGIGLDDFEDCGTL